MANDTRINYRFNKFENKNIFDVGVNFETLINKFGEIK